MCLELAAGHASQRWLVVPGHPGGPRPPHLGWVHPNPSASCWRVGLLPPLSRGGAGSPLRLCGAAWCFDTIYGVGVSMSAEQVGESPCPSPWQGRAAPASGSPHPALPVLGGGGTEGAQRPARLLPANLFPLRLPPPSPPALLQEEIQQLKSKLEKVEKERNELRLNSDRLESRVGPCWHREGVRCRASGPWRLPQPTVPLPSPQITELTSELTDERNTGESASQLLDAETAERLRAEKEMKDLQVHALLPGLVASPGPSPALTMAVSPPRPSTML